MKGLLLLIAFLFIASPLQAVKRELIHLDELMTDREQIETGVKILRAEEKKKLEEWLERFIEKKQKEIAAPAEDVDTVVYKIRSNQEGLTITLDDGSVWQIGSFDKTRVRYWLPQQRIQIIRNRSSMHPFRLLNMTIGESANASLLKPSTSVPQEENRDSDQSAPAGKSSSTQKKSSPTESQGEE